MPYISFFADEHDAAALLARLNGDPEVAFIAPDGPSDPEEAYAARLRASLGDRAEGPLYAGFDVTDDGYRQRWKAVSTVTRLKDGRHSLWHIPAGPLPLLTEDGTARAIFDPWAGWVEECPGYDPTTPYFGPGCPAEVGLDLWTRHRPYSGAERAALPLLNAFWDREADLLMVSDFTWIGGRYRFQQVPRATWRWWNRLRYWVRRAATDVGSGRHHFWAFPSALRRLRAGTSYYARGFDLTAGIGRTRAGRSTMVRLKRRDEYDQG